MASQNRSYVADLPGGTATTTIQIQGKQTLKWFLLSVAQIAAGKVELSKSSTPQIGTAQPTPDVICRVNISAGGATGLSTPFAIPINLPAAPFQNLYVHQTGAGNLGNAVLY